MKQLQKQDAEVAMYKSDIEHLDKGEIPPRLENDYKSFVAGVRKALNQPRPVMRQTEVAPKLTDEVLRVEEKKIESPDMQAASIQSMKVDVVDKPDFAITHPETGETVMLSEFLDEIEDDKALINELNACIMGAK
jgi:hypothetical protein